MKSVPALLSIFIAASASPAAQVTTGSISGVLLDPSGKPIAGCSVTASDPLHSISRNAVSDNAGFYRFLELAPSAYDIAASCRGFERMTTHDVRLEVNARLRLDMRLSLAAIQQSVEVTATVRPIQVESSELGTVLDQERIKSLPLNRRDFLQLAFLTPGVMPPVEDSELSTRGSFAMHANGGREEFNDFLLDGVDNNDPYVNGYALEPSVETIQEFKIATNSYSAEYGRSASGQVNVVTRRGTNEFHGFAYEYLRNRVLDARNFFDGSNKPKYNRNQFGFGLGGPVVGGRLAFFTNADFLSARQGLSRLGTVPRAEERRGDLSALKQTVVDPFTRKPFPGNTIPPERISPIARKVLELFPLPNLSGYSGNYLLQPVMRANQTQANLRVDYHLSQSDDLTVRYSHGYLDLFEPFAEDTASLPGFGDFLREPAHNALIQYQRIFGPRTMNSFRVGFNRLSRAIVPENNRTDVGKLWGVRWLDVRTRDWGYPMMNVAGYSRVGDATSLPIDRHTNTFQFADGLSISRGRHLFKLGGEIRRLQLNGYLDLLTRGTISFPGYLSGSGIGDLLLGFPSFALQAQADNPMTMRTTAYNAYLQYDRSAGPNLTLYLGVRYEYNSPPTDPTNRMSTLDWTTGRIVRLGINGVSASGISPDRNNFAPRVGVAWSPTGKLVIRSGYGVYSDSGMFIVSSAQYFNPPQFNLRVYFPTPSSLLTLENPFPSGGGITPPPSLSVVSPDWVGGYLQHWNLSVQRMFGSSATLSLAYAGSKGTHLVRSRDANQPAPGSGDVQARRPIPGYGSIFFSESGGNSNFNSFQAAFNSSLHGGLSAWVAYTFAKSIDDTSAFLESKPDRNFPQDSRNYRAERGRSSFDLRQRLALAWIYQLPGQNRWTRDTEFRSIVVLQTGQPFTPALRFDNSNTGNSGGTTGSDRPNLLRNPRLSRPTPERWFDTGAFAVAPPYTFGNAGRNIVGGPGYASFDLSLARRFQLREKTTISFEAQAFNLLNQTNFELPELYADEPATFGRIFAARSPRQIQFALRLTF